MSTIASKEAKIFFSRPIPWFPFLFWISNFQRMCRFDTDGGTIAHHPSISDKIKHPIFWLIRQAILILVCLWGVVGGCSKYMQVLYCVTIFVLIFFLLIENCAWLVYFSHHSWQLDISLLTKTSKHHSTSY